MIALRHLAAAERRRQELYTEAEQERLVARARPLTISVPNAVKLPRPRLVLGRLLARYKPAVLVLNYLGSR
jgi:hypothetical protein